MGSYNIADFDSLVRSYLTARIKEKYPDIDASSGSVFDDLYVKPNTEVMQPFIDAANLSDIIMDLSNADFIEDTILESVGYNNYGLVRDGGMKATTMLSISYTRISEVDNIVIPAGTTFYTSSNLGFQTTSTHTFTPKEMQQHYNPSTVLYTITIPVTAVESGSQYNVGSNQITVFPSDFPNYTDSVTNQQPVTNGVDQESKASYAERIRRFYVSRYLGTKPGYEMDIATVLNGVLDTKIVGKNDPEMQRDLQDVVTPSGVKQIHIGGKTDIYLKGSSYEQHYISMESSSGTVILSSPYADINISSIVGLNLSDTRKEVTYDVTQQDDKMILIIKPSSYTVGDVDTIQFRYLVTSGDEKVDQFVVGDVSYLLDTPFVEVTGIYNTEDESIRYPMSTVKLIRRDGMGDEIDATSPYYLSSQEVVRASIVDATIPNGTQISMSYSVNATIDTLRSHYDVEENRLIATDVLIKEAAKHYVNLKIQIKMKELSELDDTKRVQLENAISSYVDSLKIGERISESDVVSSIYTVPSILDWLLYVKLPFAAFYEPETLEEELRNYRIDASYILPTTLEYIAINKMQIEVLQG